jgi:ribonuclease BN (tRNA processing enzyme)
MRHASGVSGGSRGVVFENERLIISAGRLDHDIETFGYRVQEKDSYTLNPDMLSEAGVSGEAAGELKSKGRVRVGSRTVRVEEGSGPFRSGLCLHNGHATL